MIDFYVFLYINKSNTLSILYLTKEVAMAKPKKTITEYRNYYLSPQFPVILLSGEHWKISDIPSTRLHFHNCLEIGIVHSGSGILKFYDHSLHFKAGDVTVIPRNVSHTTYSAPGTQSHWSYLFLDPKELFYNFLHSNWTYHDLSRYYLKGYKHILSENEYPTIHSLVKHIIEELLEEKANYQLSVQGLLLAVYIDICRIQKTQSESVKNSSKCNIPDNALLLAPVLDYIEDNYTNPLHISQLSSLCHWSPTHFRRIFHDIIGTSPLDFINSKRILKSCNLLCTTQESVLNISEMVGFHSLSSYNRCFTKMMHMSPREYRKQNTHPHFNMKQPAIQEYAGWLFPEE